MSDANRLGDVTQTLPWTFMPLTAPLPRHDSLLPAVVRVRLTDRAASVGAAGPEQPACVRASTR
ncbi:hypothetical protein CKO44_10240 [Rubrivivax gelatinosus]|uniref:hypothetical protein n=1 Tax=Rubrivivax gelatinosus TaxID=28068 RepID=UPI0019061EF8|nr:hypothetical protein [Rubrivivax gelatinosus]MBK1613847.1 hypothetical protein [Rubrivivax gelatinosus]